MKKMKHCIALLLALCILLGSAPITVGAEEGASVQVTDATVSQGSYVNIYINASNFTDIASLDLEIYYDSSVMIYDNYSLRGILTLARAALACAEARKESRGAHYRSDHPEVSDDYSAATIVSYDDGKYRVRLDKEHEYES